jgi:hypothetical protein
MPSPPTSSPAASVFWLPVFFFLLGVSIHLLGPEEALNFLVGLSGVCCFYPEGIGGHR